jgi:hypothetical protein
MLTRTTAVGARNMRARMWQITISRDWHDNDRSRFPSQQENTMRVITGMLLCMWSVVSAQDMVSATLVSDPFDENYEPEVSVSGNVVVGIMTPAAALAILSDQIVIIASEEADDQQLCLKVSSRDGIYTSRNVYAVPHEAAGNIRLPYHSTHEKDVKKYGAHELALSAKVGDCDSGGMDYYLLDSAAADEATPAVMYINSFGATDVFIKVNNVEKTCKYITEGRRTTFDFICPLNIAAGDGAVPITINRERYGREQPSILLRVIGGPP